MIKPIIAWTTFHSFYEIVIKLIIAWTALYSFLWNGDYAHHCLNGVFLLSMKSCPTPLLVEHRCIHIWICMRIFWVSCHIKLYDYCNNECSFFWSSEKIMFDSTLSHDDVASVMLFITSKCAMQNATRVLFYLIILHTTPTAHGLCLFNAAVVIEYILPPPYVDHDFDTGIQLLKLHSCKMKLIDLNVIYYYSAKAQLSCFCILTFSWFGLTLFSDFRPYVWSFTSLNVLVLIFPFLDVAIANITP